MDDKTTYIAEQFPKTSGTALLFLTVLIGLAAWYLRDGINWLVVLILIAVFFLLTGKTLTGRGLGILINDRNLMSLSRLQLVIWTALIVSGFFVIAIVRIKSADVDQPLSIGIDWQIWTLLGISTTSFVGTPLLYGNKMSEEPKDPAKIESQTASQLADVSAQQVADNRRGILYANPRINDARFTDMFQGDELVNTHLVDVAKLQLFFFTIAIAIAYGTQLYQLIAYGDLRQSDIKLPELQNGLLALMGVSHAGYLGSKSIDKTPTEKS
jgi:hypothetical protein